MAVSVRSNPNTDPVYSTGSVGSFNVGAPVLGAAASIGSNLLGNFFQISSQREQNEWSEKMWRLNNEYNKPINQRRRLEEAGLNPNLMYGGSGNVSEAEQPSSPNAPTMSAPLQGFDVGQAMMNNINVQAQARLASAQAAKADEEAANQQIKNQYEEQQQLSDLYNKMINAKKGSAEYYLAKVEYDYKRATLNDRIEGVKLDNRNKEAMRKQAEAEEKKLLAEQALLKVQTEWTGKLNQAQIGVLRAQAYSYMTDAQQAIKNGESLRSLNESTKHEIGERIRKMGVDSHNASEIAKAQVRYLSEQAQNLHFEVENPWLSRIIPGLSGSAGSTIGAVTRLIK